VIMQESILAGLPGATKAGGAVGTAAGNSFVTNFLSQAAKAPTFLGALGQKPAPTPMAGGAYEPAKEPNAPGAKKQHETYEKWVREHPHKPPKIDFKGFSDHGKKAGESMAKGMIDAFKDGAEGLGKAFAKIEGLSPDQLKKFFDPMSKEAKKGGEETVAAIKASTAGVNEWLAKMGDGIKLTEAQYISLDANTRKALDDASLAWKQHAEAVDLAAAKIQTTLKSSLGEINKV